MKVIEISKGKRVLVDDADYEWLSRTKWMALRPKRKVPKYYAQGRPVIDGKKVKNCVLMHRVILGVTDRSVVVDHADGDGLNNQRSNLRRGDYSQNNMNRRKSLQTANSSRFKGVVWDKARKKWRAYFKVGGKQHFLGRFESEAEAAAAYDQAAKKTFGSFALLNSAGLTAYIAA